MPLPTRIVQVSRRDRAALEALVRARTTPQRIVERAKIVLASRTGLSGNAIRELIRSGLAARRR